MGKSSIQSLCLYAMLVVSWGLMITSNMVISSDGVRSMRSIMRKPIKFNPPGTDDLGGDLLPDRPEISKPNKPPRIPSRSGGGFPSPEPITPAEPYGDLYPPTPYPPSPTEPITPTEPYGDLYPPTPYPPSPTEPYGEKYPPSRTPPAATVSSNQPMQGGTDHASHNGYQQFNDIRTKPVSVAPPMPCVSSLSLLAFAFVSLLWN